MSAELYKVLLHFETLESLSADKILRVKNVFVANKQKLSAIQDYAVNFAFDDVMKKLNLKMEDKINKKTKI